MRFSLKHPLFFWIAALLTVGGYFVFRLWFPLLPYFNRVPPSDIRTFASSLESGIVYAFLLTGLFALYWLAYRRSQHYVLSLTFILLTTVIFCLPLLQTYPINATDIYRYFIRGRIQSIYHQSQYLVPPASIQDDPFLPLAGEWATETSPYGPIWELTATVVTAVSQDNLYWGLILFKLIGLMTHCAIATLIWLILAHSPHRASYTLLWAWNPALLLTFVVDAHNDSLMLVWFLLGIWFIGKQNHALGFSLMILAPLTKPIALLPLPFLFWESWQQLPHLRARLRFVALTGLSGLMAVWLTFLPFGSPFALVERLLREASSGGGFSVTILIILINRNFDGMMSITSIAAIARVLFAIMVLWLMWRAWNGRSSHRTAADIFALYILQALNFRIWYATWLTPWLILDNGLSPSKHTTYRLHVGLWFLFTTQLSVLIYGHVRVYLLGGQHFWAHLIGVPFTFALPFLLARQTALQTDT